MQILSGFKAQCALCVSLVIAGASIGLLQSTNLIAAEESTDGKKEAEKQVLKAQADSWPVFRGNAKSTGVATSQLPEKLELKWKITPEDAAFEGSAIIVNGVVYVGGLAPDGKLFAIDLKTGKINWEFQVESGFQSTPAYRDGTVFIGDSDGVFYAIDAKTGKKKWSFETGAEIISSANFHQDRVLVGSYDQILYCAKTADGSKVWQFETDGPVHSSVSVVEDRGFVTGCDQQLHIVDLTTGKEVAKVDVKSQAGTTPAILDKVLYTGNMGDTFFCINWEDAEIVWKYRNEDRQFPYHSSAAVTKDIVIVGGRDRLVKGLHPKDGKLLWSFPTKRKVDSSPVIVGERVFFGTDGGRLHALNIKDGKSLWEYEAGGHFATSPAVAEGCLVIGNDNGEIYCFGKK